MIDAGKLVKGKNGLLIIMNHFSYRDGPGAFLYVASRNEAMIDKPWLAPVARHISDVTGLLNRMFRTEIDIRPIVTTSTVKRPEFAHLPLGDGLHTYMEGAAETLRKGGVVVLAPQATRMPYLKEPGEHDKAMALLMRLTTRDSINNIGILPVGFGVAGVKDYTDYSGLNVGVPYRVNVGPLWLKSAVLQSARKSGWTLDKWAFEQLRQLVPPDYPKIPPHGDIYTAGN